MDRSVVVADLGIHPPNSAQEMKGRKKPTAYDYRGNIVTVSG